jgi:peptidoglycan hydrolase-like protein with peptidoglycan-binding domain
MDRAMSTTVQPLTLLHPRRRPGSASRPTPGRRRTPRLLAVALVPGAAASAEVVPAIDARRAQSRLVELGLLAPAAATGRWNPPTVDAVRAFQSGRGLEPSGVAGAATVGRLLAA